MIRCSVVGAKGYTGCEIVKLLLAHPEVFLSVLADKDDTAEPLDAYISNIPKGKQLSIQKFDFDAVVSSSDVIYLALPHTKSIDFVLKLKDAGKIIIDLSADFRLQNVDTYETWYKVKHAAQSLVKEAVYGLPELNRAQIQKADIIANPGCYPTSVILGLMPLLKEGLIELDSIVVDAKTGISGAGRNPTAKNHFCEVHENFQGYKVNQHQHMPEIEEIISGVAHKDLSITFVPHLLPILRGILSTIYVQKKKGVKAEKIYDALSQQYEKEPFVRVLEKGCFPQTKNVKGTNFCDIGLWADDASSRVIIMSAIDNLVKGASGQAVQNMNIRCGCDETAGLI